MDLELFCKLNPALDSAHPGRSINIEYVIKVPIFQFCTDLYFQFHISIHVMVREAFPFYFLTVKSRFLGALVTELKTAGHSKSRGSVSECSHKRALTRKFADLEKLAIFVPHARMYKYSQIFSARGGCWRIRKIDDQQRVFMEQTSWEVVWYQATSRGCPDPSAPDRGNSGVCFALRSWVPDPLPRQHGTFVPHDHGWWILNIRVGSAFLRLVCNCDLTRSLHWCRWSGHVRLPSELKT